MPDIFLEMSLIIKASLFSNKGFKIICYLCNENVGIVNQF